MIQVKWLRIVQPYTSGVPASKLLEAINFVKILQFDRQSCALTLAKRHYWRLMLVLEIMTTHLLFKELKCKKF